MANSTPINYNVFAHLFDVMGIEVNWFRDGAWTPDSDAIMNYRRTMSYHKPYLLLQNTDLTSLDKSSMERYMRRCLFYDIFPSVFSADAATKNYWTQPMLYDRDRPLFKMTIPALQTLSHAGWEPVTWARTSDRQVWVERYGTRLFTMMNSTGAALTTRVTIELDKLLPAAKLRSVRTVTVTDILTHRRIAEVPAGPETTFRVRLYGDEVMGLSILAQ
jgi:hypothetical protein